jgi:hypothetical protein
MIFSLYNRRVSQAIKRMEPILSPEKGRNLPGNFISQTLISRHGVAWCCLSTDRLRLRGIIVLQVLPYYHIT